MEYNDEGEPDLSLNQAALRGDLERLECLLENCDPAETIRRLECKDYLGNTALRLAATAGHADCVRLLLSRGADPNVIDVKAQTPLFVTTKNQHTECMRALLSHGANPDGDYRNVSNPLFLAAMAGFTDGVKLLLDYGVDITFNISMQQSVRPYFMTPLYIAVAYHQYDCIRLLLTAGCDPNRDAMTRCLADHIKTVSLYHLCIGRNADLRMLELLYDFGTDLYNRDPKTGRYAWEHNVDCSARDFLLTVKDLHYRDAIPLIDLNQFTKVKVYGKNVPRSLVSHCRLVIRKVLGAARLSQISNLPLPTLLHTYLLFTEYNIIK